ncbi:MAG: hypothetical protein PHN44_04360 [Candidatus Marinimicrobia bacterium]|nr:hypothetical protein [Candidatus Neomarinimicrobiota bacterium]
MRTSRVTGGRVNLRAFSVGPAQIKDLWLVVDGARVNNGSKVAAGKEFVVMASFSATNAKTGLLNAWSVCLTVTDDTGAVRNYRRKDSTFATSTIESSSLELDRMGKNTMPDVATLNLRVKIWGSDELHPSTEYPDLSLW